jgi:mycothiol system anti-sigma-R factor
VNCDLTRTSLHGYLDGELDATRASEFERHLETCRECHTALNSAESLRSALQHSGLYERAPESLRQKVRIGLKNAAVAEVPRRVSPLVLQWLAAAAVLLLLVGGSWLAFPAYFDKSAAQGPGEVTAAELLDAHVRSLQPGHLTDVVSTDQHTVKPWFDGKLDFVPPVKDYADEGFPLMGGRLDVLSGRSVAVMVYGRRKHVINVFAWPTQEPDLALHPSSVHQGYQWVHWRHQGMEFCAVSDVATPDLRELAQLFSQQ